MNIYAVDAGEIERIEWIDYESNVGYYDNWYALAIVRAKSPGQARAIAAQIFEVEFTYPMKTRLLLPDVQGEPGDLTDVHSSIWWLYSKIFHPEITTVEFIGYQE